MLRFEVRNQIYEEMGKLGLIRGKEPNPMRLGLCSRTKDIIEPMIAPQWYMKCEDIGKRMVKIVEDKELTIIPEAYN